MFICTFKNLTWWKKIKTKQGHTLCGVRYFFSLPFLVTWDRKGAVWMEFSGQMFFILFRSHEIFMEGRRCLKPSRKAFKNHSSLVAPRSRSRRIWCGFMPPSAARPDVELVFGAPAPREAIDARSWCDYACSGTQTAREVIRNFTL